MGKFKKHTVFSEEMSHPRLEVTRFQRLSENYVRDVNGTGIICLVLKSRCRVFKLLSPKTPCGRDYMANARRNIGLLGVGVTPTNSLDSGDFQFWSGYQVLSEPITKVLLQGVRRFLRAPEKISSCLECNSEGRIQKNVDFQVRGHYSFWAKTSGRVRTDMYSCGQIFIQCIF